MSDTDTLLLVIIFAIVISFGIGVIVGYCADYKKVRFIEYITTVMEKRQIIEQHKHIEEINNG